ncbi:MAG: hypothetical protein WDO12_13005 [Pseudomonadota bacterium]
MPNETNSGFLYRLFLGPLARAPERVRERMLETVPTTPVSLFTYSATLLLICGTTAWIEHGATWTLVWLAASIVLVGWRALYPWYAQRKGRPRPLIGIMLSSGLAMISFGIGSAFSIHTGDVALTTMALSGTMGVMAGVATRWAALQRAGHDHHDPGGAAADVRTGRAWWPEHHGCAGAWRLGCFHRHLHGAQP